MYKYMRDNLEDTWGFLELQDKILEIAVYADNICTQNNIQYCLMGGSALGAIRHKGFIPWDDDLDFFMTPDNYKKFKMAFEKNGDKSKFSIQEFGKCDDMCSIAKIRMNDTAYIEDSLKEYDINHGIYIDIFMLHNAPNNIFARYHQYIWSKYLVVKGASNRGVFDRYSFPIRVILKFMRIFPKRFLMKYAFKQVYKYDYKKTKYCCNYLGRAKFKKGTYLAKWFSETKRLPFEKVELNCPIGLEEFMKQRFGDYMKIPPIDTIKRLQHASIWDTKNSYKIYLKNFDETKKIENII